MYWSVLSSRKIKKQAHTRNRSGGFFEALRRARRRAVQVPVREAFHLYDAAAARIYLVNLQPLRIVLPGRTACQPDGQQHVRRAENTGSDFIKNPSAILPELPRRCSNRL